jgi:hypothetical protein
MPTFVLLYHGLRIKVQCCQRCEFLGSKRLWTFPKKEQQLLKCLRSQNHIYRFIKLSYILLHGLSTTVIWNQGWFRMSSSLSSRFYYMMSLSEVWRRFSLTFGSLNKRRDNFTTPFCWTLHLIEALYDYICLLLTDLNFQCHLINQNCIRFVFGQFISEFIQSYFNSIRAQFSKIVSLFYLCKFLDPSSWSVIICTDLDPSINKQKG